MNIQLERFLLAPLPPYRAPPMTSATPATPTPTESASGTSSVFFTILRVLGFVALALMLASIVYAAWIALANWGTIQV